MGRFLTIATVCGACVGAIPPRPGMAEEKSGGRGPDFLHAEADNDKLLVLCEKSGTVLRLDPKTGTVEEECAVGTGPEALAIHPDGRRMYVSCRPGQEVVELEVASLTVLRRWSLVGDPTGLAVSMDGSRLYVAVHALDQVAVLDLVTGKEIKRLATGNGPESVQLLPQTGRIYVTNLLSNPVPPDEPCRNEVSVIDDATGQMAARIVLVNANVGRGISFTPDGSIVLVAVSRPKNLIPMTQVSRGWVVTNGFAVLLPGREVSPIQLSFDLPNQAFADAFGVVAAPAGDRFYLTAAGSDCVVVLDTSKLMRVVNEAIAGDLPNHADHLGLSRRYVIARIPVGANPRALAISPDGRWVYVANRLDDSISVINTRTDQVARTLVLGRPPPRDRLAEGEVFFHSAARTRQNQFSCVSCHPDEGFDGLRYDLEPDGLGRNLVDNRSLRAIQDTAPFKWVGSNPDVSTQCGTRTGKWITRTQWLTSTEVISLTQFIHSIPPVASPYHSAGARLTEAQARGRDLFRRTVRNDGAPIPELQQCHACHSGPSLTNLKAFDVGTRGPNDDIAEFDTPHLTGIYETAPYLHDGRAATLEEIWTKYNPDDRHGISSDWTKRQLNDLVDYLKTIGAPEEDPS